MAAAELCYGAQAWPRIPPRAPGRVLRSPIRRCPVRPGYRRTSPAEIPFQRLVIKPEGRQNRPGLAQYCGFTVHAISLCTSSANTTGSPRLQREHRMSCTGQGLQGQRRTAASRAPNECPDQMRSAHRFAKNMANQRPTPLTPTWPPWVFPYPPHARHPQESLGSKKKSPRAMVGPTAGRGASGRTKSSAISVRSRLRTSMTAQAARAIRRRSAAGAHCPGLACPAARPRRFPRPAAPGRD